MTGQRNINRGVFRASHFRQWRIHQRVQMLSIFRNVRAREVYSPCRDGREQPNDRRP